jgi:hypothetical protein
LKDYLGGQFRHNAVIAELDDIQATVLHHRPEPYAGRIVS